MSANSSHAGVGRTIVSCRLLAGVFAAGALVLGAVGFHASPAFAAGDLNEAQCPNEALSGFSGLLPDCRAYEMVTPPYKEGYPFFGEGYSHNGEQFFLSSFSANLAGVAGDGQSVEGTVYMDSRTAGGWQLSPVNPSSGVYARQFLPAGDVEPESGYSLWEMHTLEQPATADELYLRSPGGGLSLVGPVTRPDQVVGPPSDYGVAPEVEAVGASDETGETYNHVVLRSNSNSGRWEFDPIQGNGPSLYEYTGTGNVRPTLVGVFGEKGSLALTGVIEGRHAGFECGVELGSSGGGSSGGSSYNSISRDGETIFFTPVLKERVCEATPATVAPTVAEVWARVHGSVRSPVAAETVDVSARSPSECTGVCAVSVESGKFFEGASESGEKAFFESTQQLLDSAHQDPDTNDNAAAGGGCAETGGEGGCNLYEYDFAAPAGHRLKLVAGGAEVLGVARISEDGSRVYFVARGVLTSEANAYGAHAQSGQPNLYVYNTVSERLEPHGFIATLDSETDEEDWRAADVRPVETVPADGRFLVFASSASGLTPDDSAREAQLFEYDAQSGELVRVSKAEGDAPALTENGNASESTIEGPKYHDVDFKSPDPPLNIAESEEAGSPVVTVAFESTGELSVRATAAQQECFSVYEYRSTGPIANGGVYLVSDGQDTQLYKGFRCGAEFVGMDAGGSNILFSTADPLLSADTDGVQRDIYDARLDGGFAASSAGGTTGCDGGGEPPCTGAGLPGNVSSPGGLQSALQSAEGNAAPGVAAKKVTTAKRSAGGRLARALRACRARRRARTRASCEASARRRYGSKHNQQHSSRAGRKTR